MTVKMTCDRFAMIAAYTLASCMTACTSPCHYLQRQIPPCAALESNLFNDKFKDKTSPAGHDAWQYKWNCEEKSSASCRDCQRNGRIAHQVLMCPITGRTVLVVRCCISEATRHTQFDELIHNTNSRRQSQFTAYVIYTDADHIHIYGCVRLSTVF